MSQNSIDDVLILNASDNFDGPTAATTSFNIDIVDVLESLGPGHSDVPFSGLANFSIGDSFHSFAAFSWRDCPTQVMIWGKDAVVAR